MKLEYTRKKRMRATILLSQVENTILDLLWKEEWCNHPEIQWLAIQKAIKTAEDISQFQQQMKMKVEQEQMRVEEEFSS